MTRTSITPYFNTKNPSKILYSLNCNGMRFDLDVQALKDMAKKPIVFVFEKSGNAWAHEFITQFRCALIEWSEDGESLEMDTIAATDTRYDLQEKLYHHRWLTADTDAVIVSIGDAMSTEVARFRTTFEFYNIMQLFCITSNPKELELATFEGHLLPNTSGVFTVNATNFEKPISTLQSVHGHVWSVGIVYDASSQFDVLANQRTQTVDRIIQECRRQGIYARPVLLSEDMDIATELELCADEFDAFITLKDSTVYASMDALSDFCAEHKIVLVSSELASVFQGAAIGFGNAPAAYVFPLIELIAQNLASHEPVNNFEAVEIEENMQMRHNINNIKDQIPFLSKEKEDLLEMLSIYASY